MSLSASTTVFRWRTVPAPDSRLQAGARHFYLARTGGAVHAADFPAIAVPETFSESVGVLEHAPSQQQRWRSVPWLAV